MRYSKKNTLDYCVSDESIFSDCLHLDVSLLGRISSGRALQLEVNINPRKPFNLVSVLYVLMRYLPIISQTYVFKTKNFVQKKTDSDFVVIIDRVDLAIVTGVFNTTHNICGGLLWFTDILTTVAIAITDIFFIFRS